MVSSEILFGLGACTQVRLRYPGLGLCVTKRLVRAGLNVTDPMVRAGLDVIEAH